VDPCDCVRSRSTVDAPLAGVDGTEQLRTPHGGAALDENRALACQLRTVRLASRAIHVGRDVAVAIAEEQTMVLESVHKAVEATLAQIRTKHSDVEKALEKAYGYAVFPDVGRASAVLGGAHGRGEVFERGERVGSATMTQITLGVQLGGQTFSEIVLFNSKEALYRFKRGRVAFSANASVALLKAGAYAVSNYEKDVVTRAFSHGGMQLELAMGFQRFHYRSVQEEGLREQPTEDAMDADARAEREEESEGEEDKAKGEERPGPPHGMASAAARLGDVSSKVMDAIKTRGKQRTA
jgi:lipid-binding SYLF domain-containing protein